MFFLEEEQSDENIEGTLVSFSETMPGIDHQYDRVVTVITKEPKDRKNEEIQQIQHWFKKKSDLFNQLNNEILHDLIKNCELSATVERDFVILKQGDKGDCFFIILNGSVAIYINTNYSADDDKQEAGDESNTIMKRRESKDNIASDKPKELERSRFGNYVGKLESGKSFGELALINPDCVRNATIIADEPTDLIVIDRNLYNRCIRSFHEKEFSEKMRFVENNPLFSKWNPKYRRQLAMSFRKEKLHFESTIVKQGSVFDGLRFILSGQANLTCDPRLHSTQYPDYYPIPDVDHLEEEEVRESLRRELHMSSHKAEQHKNLDVDQNRLSPHERGRNGARSPKPKRHRNTELCLLGTEEIIGDMEVAMNLNTYSYSIVCVEETEIFVLDQKNYERLIEKRNPQVIDMIKFSVLEKYSLRLSWLKDKNEVPFYRYMLYKLAEIYKKKGKKDEVIRRSKERGSPK